MGARKGEWLQPADGHPVPRRRAAEALPILDTSVIIDGRIADVCETGFLDGTLVIPQFVLKELQLVADSPDSLKRNRGRRGLDILQKVQKMSGRRRHDLRHRFPEVREVDLKLIELARTLQGKIVTNDFNLNKVAQLRGVQVLNINELANALKPVVLPGEFMKVFILKEGKEYNQGVAYLDDGTMVVVDNARRMISKNIDIVVTSVLQTTAGKMIFGRYIDAPALSRRLGRSRFRRGIQRRRRVVERGWPRPAQCEVIPPYHWWRTVFFLILSIAVFTIVLGTTSVLSSLSIRAVTSVTGARASGVAGAQDDGRPRLGGRARPAGPTPQLRVRVEPPEHLRHTDRLRALPIQLRIVAKASLGNFPFVVASAENRPPAGRPQESWRRGRQEDGPSGQRREIANRVSRGDAQR